MTADLPPDPGGTTKRRGGAERPKHEPPPQAVMGLLNYLTATSLDEDYAEASRTRTATGGELGLAGVDLLDQPVVAGAGVVGGACRLQGRRRDQDAEHRQDDQRREAGTFVAAPGPHP